jgi:hypothetical protein
MGKQTCETPERAAARSVPQFPVAREYLRPFVIVFGRMAIVRLNSCAGVRRH